MNEEEIVQILLLELVYLIWVLRCKRVIQGKHHQEEETKRRWLQAINERLTINKITATKIKETKNTLTLSLTHGRKPLRKRKNSHRTG